MARGVIYTAIFGGYDPIPKIEHVEKDVDYVVFTDQEKVPAPWHRGELVDPQSLLTNAERNRFYKSVPRFKDNDWSLYIDGNKPPKGPMAKVVKSWLKRHDIALMKHPIHDCAYTEIELCRKLKKAHPAKLREARYRLKKEGLPEHWGAWACGCIARRCNVPWLTTFGAMWWNYISTIVHRDQITLPLVLWQLKAKDKVKTITTNVWTNKWFHHVAHRPRKLSS